MSKPEGTGRMTDDLMARVPAAIHAEVRRGASLARLLELDGVRLRRGPGGVAEANCPFPAHPLRSDSFRIDLANPQQFWCTKCGVQGGMEEYLWARFGGTDAGVGGGQGAGAGLDPLLRKVEREVLNWRAPAVECVFEALLNKLTLYPEHAEFLLSRGISNRRLLDRQFRSLPVERTERVTICEELASEGCDLESVPGFFKLPNRMVDASAPGQ